MIAMEEIQSIDIYQINGSVEDGFDEPTTPSPGPASCNSSFFCTKRQQRLVNNQTEFLISDIEIPIEKLNIRSLLSLPVTDEKNSSKKVEDLVQQRQCLPIIYPGFQQKKSPSLKLTHLDGNNSCPKKVVRFADDFGFDLSQMKMINTDELPYISSEAFKHLKISKNQTSVKVITYMELQFENPMHTQGFNDRLSRHKIVLEQANAIDNRIYGTIRLISFGLHKQVKIRLTMDNWISFRDHDATYINDSYDGLCDRFSFILEIDRYRICIGNNIQFCICYELFGGSEYWDNNYQNNYRFNCFSRTIPDYRI